MFSPLLLPLNKDKYVILMTMLQIKALTFSILSLATVIAVCVETKAKIYLTLVHLTLTIRANQASLACWVPWIGHYSLSITSINFLFKASQNPDDRGLSKYIYLCNSCTRCSHIKFNHLSGQSDIFKLSFSPRTIPIWDSLPQEIVHASSPASFSAGVSAWRKSLSA